MLVIIVFIIAFANIFRLALHTLPFGECGIDGIVTPGDWVEGDPVQSNEVDEYSCVAGEWQRRE